MSTLTIDQAMEIAVGHHQAGRLAEAEDIYRRVLGVNYGHAAALHLLGVLTCQTGRTATAIDLIGRAIAVNPDVAEYHNDLGESYRRAGELNLAIASLERAVALKPGVAMTHNNLGNALMAQGRAVEAVAAFSRAVALDGADALFPANLGIALYATGRRDEAIASYRRALAQGRDDPAVESNLGVALQELDRTGEAIAAYRRALALDPNHVLALRNLGVALHRAGRVQEAIAASRQAITLGGDHAMAYSNLGMALQEIGQYDQAISALQRAIALDPAYVDSYNHLGNALRRAGRLDEASAAYRQAIALVPDYPYAYNNLAGVYKEQGRLDEGLAALRRAVALKPDYAEAASNRLFDLHFHPDYDSRAILAEHCEWAARYAAPLAAQIRTHHPDRSPDRRLRIGFVSPDLHSHPVGQLLLPLFAHHDRGHNAFVAYSDVREPDGLTARLKAHADEWHDTIALSDQDLADQVRTDRVDILVDLTLHTANNRLLVFARKPAPVQATMLGLPATTGLATMDYRLTDPYLDPPDAHDDAYVERSIRLPHCFWCYQPAVETAPADELPALRNGHVTFGCLNQFSKVTRPALLLWVKILVARDDSRLVLHAPTGRHRDEVRALFQEGGVAPERIEFVAKVVLSDYMMLYRALDLCLDPFPFSGATTTMDALWMGVPVITLAGRTAVGRGGVSILSNLGLPGLIARTPEQYVALALDWAADQSRLAELHAGLRQQMLASPLMDGKQYAADVENALRRMWKEWRER